MTWLRLDIAHTPGLMPTTTPPEKAQTKTLSSLPTETHYAIAKHLFTYDSHDAFINLASTNKYHFDVAASVTVCHIRSMLAKAKSQTINQTQWVDLAQSAETLRHLANDQGAVTDMLPLSVRKMTFEKRGDKPEIHFDTFKAHLGKPAINGQVVARPTADVLFELDWLDALIDDVGLHPLRLSLLPWIQSEHGLHNGPKASEAARSIISAYKTRAAYLDLDNYHLSTLPESISEVTSLHFVSLAHNRLFCLPKSFRNLINLQHLDLCDNQLVTCPSLLSELAHLKYVDLGHNLMTEIPGALGKANRLRYLCLAGNRLGALPPGLKQLTQLRNLDLSGNRFSQLPEVVTQLDTLQFLMLNNNQLTTLPTDLKNLFMLRDLEASGNRFSAYPVSISHLRSLTTLRLSNNQIASLPASFRSLRNLLRVDLSANLFSQFPKVLGHLWTLSTINIQGNQLKTIASIMANCLNLRRIDARDNQIRALPKAILHHPRIKVIYLPEHRSED